MLLVRNIKGLVLAGENLPQVVKGKSMQDLPILEDAWLLCEEGRIADYGHMNTCPELDIETLDASGRFVLPSWVDAHTHLVFARTRETEFVMRLQGATYEEIAAAGGGILNSAKVLNETSEDELFESSWNRLDEVISQGTGAIEIKSGYGLSVEGELKMLRVIRRLKEVSPIPIKSTFLGAHAFPLEYRQDHAGYLRMIKEEMLPVIQAEGLADYMDVFCDRGFFSPAETEELLEAGLRFGLQPRIHANELDYSGGIQVGTKYNALSVDHLEFTGEAEIEALLASNTMPMLLPSTAFFLRLHYPPARKMIDAGLPVGLSSDYNPGSSPSGNMSFVLSLACLYLGMMPEEAINAAIRNTAASLELQDEVGSISKGKRANFFITQPINSLAVLPYSFGKSRVETVVVSGEVWQPKNKIFSIQ